MKTNTPLQNLVGRVADRLSPRGDSSAPAEKSPRPLVIESLEPRIMFSGSPAPAPAPAPESSPAEAPAVQESTAGTAPEAAAPVPEDSAVAAPPAGAESAPSDAGWGDTAITLTDTELAALTEAASMIWAASGISGEQASALASARYQIADLGGRVLGSAEGDLITIDDDAAGRGWFVDGTPEEDSEFAPGGTATTGVDLLSAVLHEQGHLLGLEDSSVDRADIMFELIGPGERRLPVAGEAAGAIAGSLEGAHMLTLAPATEDFEDEASGSSVFSDDGNPGGPEFTLAVGADQSPGAIFETFKDGSGYGTGGSNGLLDTFVPGNTLEGGEVGTITIESGWSFEVNSIDVAVADSAGTPGGSETVIFTGTVAGGSTTVTESIVVDSSASDWNTVDFTGTNFEDVQLTDLKVSLPASPSAGFLFFDDFNYTADDGGTPPPPPPPSDSILAVDFNSGGSPTEAGFVGQSAASFTHTTAEGALTVAISDQQGNFDRGVPATHGTHTDIYRDFFFDNSNQLTLTLSGAAISANTDYDITFYAFDEAENNSVTFTGVSGTSGSAGPISYTADADITSLDQFAAVGTFTSDGSGVLTINSSTTRPRINGFEIDATPPPPPPPPDGGGLIDAVDDDYTESDPTDEDTVLNIGAPGVFSNDDLVGNGPLSGQLGILDLSANGGINPATGNPWEEGDTYRLIFATSAGTTAVSSDIATYNTFVQDLANASPLGLGSVEWKALASTAAMAANVNTSTNTGTGESFWLLNGTSLVADNYADLYGFATHSSRINVSDTGARPYDGGDFTSVWTGSDGAGNIKAADELGAADGTSHTGLFDHTTGAHWIDRFSLPMATVRGLYGVSEVLTISGPGNTAKLSDFDAVSANGATVNINADGSFSYDPTGAAAIQALNAGESLTDTFTYTIGGPTAVVLSSEDGEGEPATYFLQTEENGPSTNVEYQLPGTFQHNNTWLQAHTASVGGAAEGSDPTGQHILTRSTTGNMVLRNPLELATGQYDSVRVDFAVNVRYGPDATALFLDYSANGSFTDSQTVLTIGSGGSDFEVQRWYAGQSVTIENGVGGITFTDTANFRWRSGGFANSTQILLDDIVISGLDPGEGVTDIATVSVKVHGVNDTPGIDAVDDDYTESNPTDEDTVLTIAAPGILGNDVLEGKEVASQLGILNLSANGGINPATGDPWEAGDNYRFIFATSQGTAAVSPDIATYNTFVQNLADASALGLGSVEWKALASTAAMAANVNTSTNTGTGESFWLLNGTSLVADNYADLYGFASHSSTINVSETGGTPFDGGDFTSVWTGSDGAGNIKLNDELGALDGTSHTGLWGHTTGAHWIDRFSIAFAGVKGLYGVSEVLTVSGFGDTAFISAFDAVSANGATVNVNADGSFSYDPTSAAAIQALDAGETLTDTFTYTLTDSLDNSETDIATVSISVSGLNDAPVLAGRNDFDTVAIGDTGNGGQMVSEIAGGFITDVDGGSVEGIAITGAASSSAAGTWQFSTDGGGAWTDVGAVSETSALLLRATDLVRYVPDGSGGATGSIRFKAWDQTGTTAGQEGMKVTTLPDGGTEQTSAFSAATADADAEVAESLDAVDDDYTTTNPTDEDTVLNISAPGVLANDTGGGGGSGTKFGIDFGPTVSDAIANNWNEFAAAGTDNTIHDLDGDILSGVTVQVTGGGFNNDGENNWVGLNSNGGSAPFAFVDSVTTDIGFNVNTTTISGLDASLTYNIYAVSHGGGGGHDAKLDTLTVTGDVGYGSSVVRRGDARVDGDFHTFLAVSPNSSGVITIAISEPTANNPVINGILVEAVAGGGAFTISAFDAVSANGATVNVNPDGSFDYDPTGSASIQALDAGDALTDTFTYTISDGMGNTDTAIVSIGVDGLNDAPALAGANDFDTVSEDDATNGGQMVSEIAGGFITDVDTGSVDGIAITAATSSSAAGTWQFSTDGGGSWADVGAVSETSGLLLRDSDLVRYLPDGTGVANGSITFKAWDQTGGTSGGEGTKVTTLPDGSTEPSSAFSADTATSGAEVTEAAEANSAPVLTGANDFDPVSEDDVTNMGQPVTELVGDAFGDFITDADTGAVEGIAITGATSSSAAGTFQFSTDGGGSWADVGAVSETSGLLLRDSDLVRYLPDGTGVAAGSITFKAWDQTGGTSGGEGTKVTTLPDGSTEPSSAFSADTATSGAEVVEAVDADVFVGGGTLTYREVAGRSDVVTIYSDGTNLIIHDDAGPVTAENPSWQVDANTVSVPLSDFEDILFEANDLDDTITVGDMPGFDGSLTIDGGEGFDTVTFAGGMTLALGTGTQNGTDENLDVDAETVKIDLEASLSVVGGGTIDITAAGGGAEDFVGIHLRGASLSSEGGAITLEGEGGSSGNHNDGVQLSHGSSITTGGGSVSITGTATGVAGPNDGVSLVGGSDITVGGAGTITITGTSSGVNDSYGVLLLTGTELTSGAGEVSVTGSSASTGPRNSGVYTNGATVTSAGGSITLDGSGGGSGGGGDNKGLRLTATTIGAGGSGGVTLTGTGGSGTSTNVGVEVGVRTEVTTASGDIVITGTGGAGTGVRNRGAEFQSDSRVISGGSLTIAGTSGGGTAGNEGVYGLGATLETTGSGALAIVGTGGGSADQNTGVSLGRTAVAGAGDVSIRGTGSVVSSGRYNDGVSLTTVGVTAGGDLLVVGDGGTGGDNNRGVYGNRVTIEAASYEILGRAHAATTGGGNAGVSFSNSTFSDTGTISGTGGGGTGPGNYGVYLHNVSSGMPVGNATGTAEDEDEETGGNYFNVVLPALVLAAGADRVGRKRRGQLAGLIGRLGESAAGEGEMEIYRESDGVIVLEATLATVASLEAAGVGVPDPSGEARRILVLTGDGGVFARLDAAGKLLSASPLARGPAAGAAGLIESLGGGGRGGWSQSPRATTPVPGRSFSEVFGIE